MLLFPNRRQAGDSRLMLQEGSKKLDKWTSFSCRDYCRRRVLMKEISAFALLRGKFLTYVFIYVKEVI